MISGWTRILRVTALSRTVRASAGRVSWGLGDQAVSSLTNFGPSGSTWHARSA